MKTLLSLLALTSCHYAHCAGHAYEMSLKCAREAPYVHFSQKSNHFQEIPGKPPKKNPFLPIPKANRNNFEEWEGSGYSDSKSAAEDAKWHDDPGSYWGESRHKEN